MVSKESYQYAAKNAARSELRDFIGKNYDLSSRKDLTVLTLMGHERSELDQLWDPLGIPRENITSVEKSKDPYNSLARQNTGVNIEYADIGEYVAETNNTFDIMNLDYDSPLNFDKIRSLQEIAYGQILGNSQEGGILSIWYSGRRENPGTSGLMLETLTEDYLNFLDAIRKRAKQNPQEISDLALNALSDKENQFVKNDYRADFLGSYIGPIFMSPLSNFEQHPLVEELGLQKEYEAFIRSSENYQKRNNAFMEAIKKGINLREMGKESFHNGYTQEAFEAFKRARKSALNNEPVEEGDKEILFEEFHLNGYQFLKEKVNAKLEGLVNNEKIPDYPKEAKEIISSSMYFSRSEPYFVKGVNRIKYHSDNGTPMLADFFSMEKPDFKSLGEFKIDQNQKLIPPYEIGTSKKAKKEVRKLGKDILEIHGKLGNQCEMAWPERKYVTGREDLGEVQTGGKTPSQEFTKSKHSQEQVKNTLSGNDVYKLIEEGNTKEQIMEMDPSWSKHQIAAKKAWTTMRKEGIKGGRPRKSKDLEEIKPSVEPSINDEKKDFAISLLKEGHSTKEILEAFPEEFSDYQLRGYKAAISRGNL